VGLGAGGGTGLDGLAGRTFDGVIFDMDGTLIDSTPAVMRAWTTWAGEHGITAQQLLDHHGIPSAAVVRSLIAADGQESAIARINELELEDLHDIVVLPGAAEALAAVHDAKSAIATSCTRPLAAARIGAARLVEPNIVVTADDVTHGKPSPDPYLEAAARLGVDPTRCLVVEDAPAGLTSARAAGCATLSVITTTPVEDLQADAIVPDLAHVRFAVTEDGRIQVHARAA
jgi:sugar-phosphatase